MAPTNPSIETCNLPNDNDRQSPTIASNNDLRFEDISTISSNYKYCKMPEEPAVDNNPINRVTMSRTQLEMEETTSKRYKLCSKPCNHNLKKYMQSFQSLPQKTRQTLRIFGIALISVVALVAIFYVARMAEKHDEDKTYENDLKFELEEAETFMGRKRGYPKLEYDLENNDGVRNGGSQPKIVKNSQGKAHYNYDNFDNENNHQIANAPVLPVGGISFDIARKKMKKARFHKANAFEISETLDLIRETVDAERKLISDKELKFWESGSEPLRILIVSTWRSGSTFLAQLLQSHPGVYEHYEPFSYLGVQQIRSGKAAFQSQQMLHKLLDCEYDGIDSYNNFTKSNLELMIGYNKRVWRACKDGPNVNACAEPQMLAEACKMFPIQLVKTVRLRLNITQLLLNDLKLKVKVLFLIRDPRGTMNSRYTNVSWCSSSTDCSSPEALCQDLQGDLKVAAAFEKLYPNRFLKIQYEDLANNADKEVSKIMNYVGLEYTKSMKDFVANYTQTNYDKPWSIKRKSVDRVSLWKKQLPLEEIHAVQNACQSVLKSMNLEVL